MSAIILAVSLLSMVFSVFIADLFRRKPSLVEEYEEDTPVAPV